MEVLSNNTDHVGRSVRGDAPCTATVTAKNSCNCL